MTEKKKSTRLIELEPRLVLLFLAIGGPFLLAGCLLILGWLRAELNQTLGEDMLGGAAADAARYLDTYLLNNLANVSVIASTPSLREAANVSNRRYVVDPEQIRDRLLEVDGDWVRGRGAVPIALDIVGNDTSEFLREIVALNPSYQEILLTDRQGALVAATNITTDYYQADEAWWRQAFGDGEQGTLYSSGVIFDTSAGGHELEMAVPVRDKLGGDDYLVIGVLKALWRASDLFSVVSAVKRGETGHALLVSAKDGTVIAGRRPEDIMRRQYPGFASLQEALSEGRKSFMSRDGKGRVWVASFAKMPEPSPAAYGDWLIVVQQEAGEAQAPTTAATWFLVLFFIGIGVLAVLFSLYLHYKLVRPIREIDLREEMERLGESGAGSK